MALKPTAVAVKLLPWLALLAVLTAVLTYGRHWQVPDRHNPWAPLRIDEAPGWLTRHKLLRLDNAPAACLATLEQATMRFTPVSNRDAGPGCGLDNAVRIESTSAQIGEPFTLSCRTAVSLALWERHALQPAATRMLGSGIRRIEHYGSFACRNVYGRADGRRSQHATADAFDVAGFVLDDGRRVTVAAHWRAGDERSAFLRLVHDQACGFFDGVLGPEYNAAHADHLHVDRGPYRVCR
ncbi:MAG: extensin family protein [Rhizobiales bacterium]|nr:extensin family protein [Rhizobacter sp.]